MIGILSNKSITDLIAKLHKYDSLNLFGADVADTVASQAGTVADAMLKEGEK